MNSPESDWDGLDPSSDAARRADDAGLEPDESVNLDDTVGPDQGPADKPTSLPDRT